MSEIPEVKTLVDAVRALMGLVGEVGTDTSAQTRLGAREFLAELGQGAGSELRWRNLIAIMDAPSGETLRRRIVVVGNRMVPRHLDAVRDEIIENIDVVLSYELPIILHRWAFDQVMAQWLGVMQLSAYQVISVQRSLLQVNGDLMVRVAKVLSDPRAQMGAVREQNVAPRDPDDRHVP